MIFIKILNKTGLSNKTSDSQKQPSLYDEGSSIYLATVAGYGIPVVTVVVGWG